MTYVKEGTFAALVRDYKASAKFRAFEPGTQSSWGRELDFAVRVLGDVTNDEIRPKLIQEYLDGWADKPGKQASALSAFKSLEKWAVVLDLLPRSITLGVETGRSTGGHTPWTEEQVLHAERHARPDLARAIVLGAWTGQRGSDLVRMGWGDIETFEGREGISLRQKKTGRELWVPILPELAERMATWERQPGPFLRNSYGGTYTREVLSVVWSIERDNNPALAPLKEAGLVLHGLRGHACVRLYRAGLTTREVSVLVGMHEAMVGRYVRKSVQKENATAAIIHLEQARNIKHPFHGKRSETAS